MAGISTISGAIQGLISWTAVENQPPTSLSIGNIQSGQSTIGKKINFITGTNVPGGANEFFLLFVSIAPGGTAIINLQSLTDILQFTNISLVRLKAVLTWLLSPTDDTTNGTNASSVTVGNAPNNPHPLFLDQSTGTFTLVNGEFIEDGRPDGPGRVVTGASQNVQFKNNDLVNSATVLFAGFGATS